MRRGFVLLVAGFMLAVAAADPRPTPAERAKEAYDEQTEDVMSELPVYVRDPLTGVMDQFWDEAIGVESTALEVIEEILDSASGRGVCVRGSVPMSTASAVDPRSSTDGISYADAAVFAREQTELPGPTPEPYPGPVKLQLVGLQIQLSVSINSGCGLERPDPACSYADGNNCTTAHYIQGLEAGEPCDSTGINCFAYYYENGEAPRYPFLLFDALRGSYPDLEQWINL